jgi:arsenite oxidase small subunit
MPSSGEDGTKKERQEDSKPENDGESRRNFLRVGLAFAAGLVILGVGAISQSLFAPAEPFTPETTTTTTTQTPSAGQEAISPSTPGFPVIMVASLSDLEVNKPVYFYYPLTDTPNILVKLGTKAEGGVGPDGDIVAFSQTCQHLGCSIGYVATGGSPACDSSVVAVGPEGYCCCHGSIYDFVNGAKVLGGPAPRPLPQVILKVDSSGNIYATGMTPPTIFGYDTGSNNVSDDLTGGTIVS